MFLCRIQSVSNRFVNQSFARQLRVRFHHVARVQKPAPEWAAPAVVNEQFQDISSTDFLGKWLVLFFYPLDFTFVCPTEIIGYSERVGEFEELNANVVGVSVDSKFSHLAWINQPRKDGGLGEMKIPLVSDLNKTISDSYGVLLEDGTAARGTFIVDPKGIVRQITINDLSVGRNIDETLRLIEGYQFADEHGEVCPLGWKKGSKTMKPDPQGSKEYFNKVN
ncbi:thioredoxin peroxidase Tpx1 [Terramyces sp. JEL0728]|nr:thioredoxin peroxidase Tpx1 [Terramyces sp. JEL0728]